MKVKQTNIYHAIDASINQPSPSRQRQRPVSRGSAAFNCRGRQRRQTAGRRREGGWRRRGQEAAREADDVSDELEFGQHDVAEHAAAAGGQEARPAAATDGTSKARITDSYTTVRALTLDLMETSDLFFRRACYH